MEAVKPFTLETPSLLPARIQQFEVIPYDAKNTTRFLTVCFQDAQSSSKGMHSNSESMPYWVPGAAQISE
jgi:hypothetical protein